MPKPLNHKNMAEFILKRITKRQSFWVCSCGYQIPKQNAKLSGYASGSQGFHVHCPGCGKVVAQFLKPKQCRQRTDT